MVRGHLRLMDSLLSNANPEAMPVSQPRAGCMKVSIPIAGPNDVPLRGLASSVASSARQKPGLSLD